MLVLARNVDQRIKIGDDITITLVRLNENRAWIGIEAPSDVLILRDELSKHIDQPQNKE